MGAAPRFHPELPRTALALGADAMLTSTHKIAGSLTQSAMLHLADTGRVDIGAVARMLRLLRSTSPSSLLIASLDAARRQLVMHGEQLLHETLRAIEAAHTKLRTIPGVRLVDEQLVGAMGIAGYDPFRIVLDVRGTGRTGYEIADELRRTYDVHVELPQHTTIVLLIGLGESEATLLRIAGDVEEIVARLRRPDPVQLKSGPASTGVPDMAVSPRGAFLHTGIKVPVSLAVGRSGVSRSPHIHPACRHCFRGNVSRRQWSSICVVSSPLARACTVPPIRNSRPSP